MDGAVLVLALCVLGILATYFGVESRDRLRSKEQELAELGAEWDERPHPPQRVADDRHAAEHLATRAG